MKRASRVVVLASLAGSLLASAASAQSPSAAITEREARAHIGFLASDALEGRDSGYRGAEVAAQYIQAHLAARGFKPLLGDWQQPFDLVNAAKKGSATLHAGSITLTDAHQIDVARYGSAGTLKATAAEASGDVAGKIAIAPGGDDAKAAQEQAAALAQRGALAVVFVSDQEKFEQRPAADGRRRGGGKPKAESKDARPAGGLLADSAFFASHVSADVLAATTLAIPVVRVARGAAAELVDGAHSGVEVTLDVKRDGVDRSANVIGWIEGSDPVLKKEYVFAGAHYDHVGKDDLGNIWNGADDNASGTTAILECADVIGGLSAPPKRSVILALWSAEERGLVGSRAFCAAPPIPFESIVGYVNMDMVSRNEPDSIFAIHVSEDLMKLAQRCGAEHGLEVTQGDMMFLNMSDSGPFAEHSVPTLFLFSGLHDKYHTPLDDPDTIDCDKLARVAQTACDMVLALADDPMRPKFDAPPAATSKGPRLGIFPDDSATEPGVTISTVADDSVGAKAGLKKGDRIVGVNDAKVTSLGDLRTQLRKVEAKKPFTLVVFRDGANVNLTATFD